MLAIRDLVKRFGGVVAVDGTSFEIPEGKIIGLIGPNGAGKTTTFNMIAGALVPTSGQVVYRGSNITGIATYQLFHKGIVRTFQIPKEFGGMTVLENLMVVPPGQPGESIILSWLAPSRVAKREQQVRERALDTLQFLGLSAVKDQLARNLSGGQKKLLELGRTMMTDAKLVLLDEPGAGVNPTLVRKIADMIKRLNRERGYTFCIIEHDMELIADLCDQVIVLAEGKVLVSGSMATVRADERVLEAYFGSGQA